MKKNNASHRAWEHENQFLQHLCCENVNIPRVASKEGRFNFFKPPLWYQAVANIVHISLGVLQNMKLCFPRCVGSQKKSDSHAAWRAHSLFLQHLSGEIAVIQALPSLRSRRPTTPLQMERFQSPGGCVAGHVKLSGVPKCLRAASCMRTGGRAGRNERTQEASDAPMRQLQSRWGFPMCFVATLGAWCGRARGILGHPESNWIGIRKNHLIPLEIFRKVKICTLPLQRC